MATVNLPMTFHTIYRDGNYDRSSGSEDPYVKCVAGEGDNDGWNFNPGETLTLMLSDETQCTGWTYEGSTDAIEDGPYAVVTKGNCAYVLGTGDTNSPGNVGEDEMEAPQKFSELNICKQPWPIIRME